jgi:O-antigen/teichoic acid export membrane protein
LTEDITATKVARGSIYLTVGSVVSSLISIVGFAFMARIITTEEMGVVAGIALLTSFAQLASDFGLNSSIPRHVSESKGKKEGIRDLVVSAVAFRIPVSITLASVIFVFANSVSSTLFRTPGFGYVIALLSLDLALLCLNPLMSNVLLGNGNLLSISVFNVANTGVSWFSIVALLLAGKGLIGYVLGGIVGDVATLAMLVITLSRIVGFRGLTLAAFRSQIVQLLKFAYPLYLGSAVSFLYTWYDKAIVLGSMSLSNLGLYNTAYQPFTVLIAIAGALGSAMLPYYGVAYGKNDHDAISLGMKRAIKYTCLTIFPLTLGLMAASKPTLTIFAGSQYEAGWTILSIFSLFGLVYGIAPALSNVLLVYRRTRTILLLSFVPVVSSLVLAPLLWILSLVGVAIMKGASMALSLILTAYFVNEAVPLRIDRKALTRTLTASALMAAVILVLEQALYNPRLLLLYVLVGAAIYIATIRMLKVLDKEDFQFLEQVIGKRSAKYVSKILGGRS